MSESEKPTAVIHLMLETAWDARGHHLYCKAPDGWDGMSDGEREKFLQDEAEDFLREYVSATALVYSSIQEAKEATRDQWGSQFSEDQLEERW